MKTVKLGEVCTIVSGSTPSRKIADYWNGTIPWVTPKEINRLKSPFLCDSIEKITDAGFKSCSTNMLPANSLLLSSRAPIGLLAINKTPVCTNQGFKNLIPNNNLNVEYLYYFLKKNTSHLQSLGNGATFKELSKSSLESFQIPLPPLPDQIRIATLLSKVETLITQRKAHLQELDTLLKSVFLQTFGDPVKNEKGWEKVKLSELLEKIESGDSPKCEARPANLDEWGILKLGAVTRCTFDETQSKALPKGILPTLAHEVKSGDLLFSRKNTYELVAACVYIFKTRSKLLIPDLIFRFVLKEDVNINKIFLWKLIINESQRKAIQSLASGAAGSMPNISKANLKTIQLPIPPLSLQNHFAAIVEKTEVLRTHYEQSLADLKTLYASLSQKAFNGTLDLSRINPE